MKSVSYKKRETLTVCMAIGVVAGGVLGASAQQQQDRGTDRSATGQQEQRDQQQRQQPGQGVGSRTAAPQAGMQQGDARRQAHAMVRASKVLDMEVHGQDGQKLGDVEEIILSQDRQSVEHIKVSLDDGGSVKLSLDELSAQHDDDDALLVRTSKEDLQRRQTQDQDRVRGAREQEELESRWASKLIGLDVQGTDGKDVGSIDDLIINIQNGQIKTAAVKTGGMFGLRTRLASVEWQQVNVAADGEAASMNMTKDALSEREHKQDEYWKHHAFEGVTGQRERSRQTDRQQSDRRTSGVSQSAAEGRIQGRDDDQQRHARTTRDTTNADNTARNVRDRNNETMTSFDQGNSKADTETTAQIRKEVNAAENMSLNGKNVKIITKDGRVTLRGPVDSEAEKRLIGEIANRIARSANVDNQLEVKSIRTTSTN